MVCEDSGMFYLNSARESSEHYVILRITPIKSSLMRPRRNYGKHYATNVAPTNASYCSLIFITQSAIIDFIIQRSVKIVVLNRYLMRYINKDDGEPTLT